MKAVNLAETGYKQVAEDSFAEVLAIAHNEQGWRVSNAEAGRSSGLTRHFHRATQVVQQPDLMPLETKGDDAPITLNAAVGGVGLGLSAMVGVRPELAQEIAHNIRITYKSDSKRDLVTVRISTELPFSVDAVTTLLIDVRGTLLLGLEGEHTDPYVCGRRPTGGRNGT